MICGQQAKNRIGDALAMTADLCNDHAAIPGIHPMFSVGLVALSHGKQSFFEQVYKMADESLYDAKRGGGNQVVQHGSSLQQVQQPTYISTVGVSS
jgi:GGDEF domain-containing protein